MSTVLLPRGSTRIALAWWAPIYSEGPLLTNVLDSIHSLGILSRQHRQHRIEVRWRGWRATNANTVVSLLRSSKSSELFLLTVSTNSAAMDGLTM